MKDQPERRLAPAQLLIRMSILRPLLKINPREVEFTRRGFDCSSHEIRERLEHIGRTFLYGYHAALQEEDQDQLDAQLRVIEKQFQGFAYEGAAMGLAILDGMNPWNARVERFLAGAGKQHIYMVHVGAGWAYARLPWLRWRVESVIRKFHPVLRWLALDGYGFHEGFFHHQSVIAAEKIPGHLSQEARHVFYQGLGRSLWFVHGAQPSAISRTIVKFDPQFHADAWSGVGLACAYAGGISEAEIEELRELSDRQGHSMAMAQGVAFACKARQLAGNPASHTELACRVICGVNPQKAAALCDETLKNAGSHSSSYRRWRESLQDYFARSLEMRGKPNEFTPQLAAPKPA